MFTLLGYAIDSIDSGDVLYNILQYGEAEKYDVYLFLGELLYVLAYVFIFICIFIGIRNKRSYIAYCSRYTRRYCVSFWGSMLISSLFGYYCMTIILACYFQMFLIYHYIVMTKLISISENQLENYLEDEAV